MVGKIWTTGITLKYEGNRWYASADIHDDGFCDGKSIKGEVSTSYGLPIASAIDVILEAIEMLGMSKEFPLHADRRGRLYYVEDGHSKEYPPPENWLDLLREQANRIGWKTY